MRKLSTRLGSALVMSMLLGGVVGCDDGGSGGDGDGDGDEGSEIITTVTLTFHDFGGSGDTITAEFYDPDGTGIMSPMVDAVVLSPQVSYTLDVTFSNELAEPAEDITAEIQDEAEEHQIFISGDGIEVDYTDLESDYGTNAEGDDLPVGLRSTVTPMTSGVGEFRLMLRHLPPLNGTPQKVPGLAEDFANGDTLPGESDVDVTFVLNVQ